MARFNLGIRPAARGGLPLFGLRAMPFLLIAFKVALALMLFVLSRTACARFWTAIVLSTLGQFVIWHLLPLPYVFSILFFAGELALLVRSRQTGNLRNLFWLPLIFAFWANLHIQFVAGLLLLALFVVSTALDNVLLHTRKHWLSPRIRALDPTAVSIVFFSSLVGSLANPYTFHVISEFRTLYSDVGFEHFPR